MRSAGREFGSVSPTVIYVAMRWNDSKPTIPQENRMIASVAQKLEVLPSELRIYNLCPPEPDLGMSLKREKLEEELGEIEQTVLRIKAFVEKSRMVQRIVVGGRSGPMPYVAIMLKLLLRRIGIEIYSHHKARAVNAGSLKRVCVLRHVAETSH